MFDFVKCTNQVSDQYILKGGHLLWRRIKIKRGTTDLDYAIRSLELNIEDDLRRACLQSEKFEFVLEALKVRKVNSRAGFNAIICFREKSRESEEKRFSADGRLIGYSHFSIDIGVDAEVDFEQIQIDDQSVQAASIINIFLDKMDACTRRGSENTRIKDFDDLVRIIRSSEPIDKPALIRLAAVRGIPLSISPDIVDAGFRQVWDRFFENEYGEVTSETIPNPVQAIEFINDYLRETYR